MNVIIRKGEEKDLPELFGLIKELAMFGKEPDAVTNTVQKMSEEQEYFGFFVAEIDGEIVGSAIYFFAYFTWVGKSLYLDDLYVKPTHRGKKIGTKLLQEIFELAQEENCHRVRWQVLDWNKSAIEFYKKAGAEISSGWLNCDFGKKDIDNFLQDEKG